ncbi:hypothetical protein [Desulfovibrio sp. ZJ200]|uniref:hypothetical protein n=1 Tax=Desulfovibrio sp. ZJ200 TaxID=2709792 RepID=UPI0013ED751B|nr:hypothetical protein [Desulfovibrio sp. ZJ200]
MKICTMLKMDIATGEVIEAEACEWDGPVALCKGGGGSSTTNTVDYAYNARMAALSEEQQAWAREYFTLWQTYQKPYEIAQAQANLAMLPLETDIYKQQLTAAKEILPQQSEATKQFMTAALDGVDVNERMALATADTANAWKDVQAATARANARLGVNPNSGRFQGIAAALDTQKAAQLAGARTQARVGAERENFDRLMKASALNAQNGILQGIGFMKS